MSQNQCNDTTSSSPIHNSKAITIQISGVDGIPSSGVEAVAPNITAVDATSSGYLTLYPTGEAQPVVSNLNFVAGSTVSNRVIVKLSSTRKITIYNFSGDTNIVIDINGYFTDGSFVPPNGSLFTPVDPIKICDTRHVQNGVLSNQCNFPSSRTLNQSASITINLPNSNHAVSAIDANVTVVNPSAPSFLAIYPESPLPVISDLNYVAGQTIANLAEITLSSSGTFNVYNAYGSADVVVDEEGYYST